MHLTLAVLATLVAAIYGQKKCNTDLDKYRADALKAHNDYRALHGSGPMTLDASATKIAQAYADYLANDGKWEHSAKESRPGLGENLAKDGASAAPATGYSGAAPVKLWYDEVKLYKFNPPMGFTKETGHFTQVVWKASTKLGIGVGFSADCKKVYTVGNYGPGGNVNDYENTNKNYVTNVLPLQKASGGK